MTTWLYYCPEPIVAHTGFTPADPDPRTTMAYVASVSYAEMADHCLIPEHELCDGIGILSAEEAPE